MTPDLAGMLLCTGFGISIPAVFGLCLRLGAGTTAIAALLAAIILAAWAGCRRISAWVAQHPWRALAAPAALALSSGLLLPWLGLRLVAWAGVILGLAGAVWLRAGAEGEPAGGPPAWLLALSGAALVAWARCLSLLWGHSLYALCGAFLAAGLGASLGLGLKARLAGFLGSVDWPRLSWFCSACAGLLGLAGLRFIGFNAGSAEHLFIGLRGPGDLVFIAGQSILPLVLWPGLLALTPEDDRGPAWQRAALAGAGPVAAWLLLPRLGAAPTAAVCHLALAAASLTGPASPLRKPVLSRLALAGLGLGLLLSWQSRGFPAEFWLNRLDAAWPGGRYRAWAEDGRELLALYRFSSGADILLRDGMAWSNGPREARLEAKIPLRLRGDPRRILLLGVRSPVTILSAMEGGAEVTSVDPHAGADLILRTQAGAWPPPASAGGAPLCELRQDPRRYLRAAGPAFDAIILELPPGFATPEWGRLTTRQAFAEVRRRLAPAGVAAVRIAAPYPPRCLARLLRTARSAFDNARGYDLPGGYLLVCSQRPLPASLPEPDLETELAHMRVDDLTELPAGAQAMEPALDDRPAGFWYNAIR